MEKRIYENIGETLYTHVLPNGLSINIVSKPEYSKAYAMFTTKYGGADRRFKLGNSWIDTPAGVAHYLEHKMFDMPDGNALNVLSSNGASPNAFTSSGITAYHFECTDKFYDNLRTLLSFVSTPYFTEESVQKERGIIGQEIRMVEDNPGFVVYNNLLRCLYRYNPIRDSVAGTVESIQDITKQVLYDCHKVFYAPSNMTLAVVGPVDPEKVIRMAEELLPTEPGPDPERDYGLPEDDFPQESSKTARMEVSAPQFLFGTKITPEPWGLARLRQQIIGQLSLKMLMGRASPFYTGLYSKGLLNNTFECELDYTAGTAMILAGGESRDVPAVMEALNKAAKELSENIDPVSFENAKKAFFGSELRALDSFSSLSQGLTEGAFSGYCPLDSFEMIGQINIDHIQSFIARYIASDKLALSVVEPTL